MLRTRWLLAASGSALFFHAGDVAAQEKCFTRLDNGVDMTGWHRSTTNHHGPGTGWTVLLGLACAASWPRRARPPRPRQEPRPTRRL